MISNKFIKSPINYTGNKFQILNNIVSKMDTQDKIFLDVFSGGLTVAINIRNAKKIYSIEKNKNVTSLLNYIINEELTKFLDRNEKLISCYNLSNSNKMGSQYYKDFRDGNNGLKTYNKTGYLQLRKDYNDLKNKNSKKALHMLYLLMIYGFNNEIRFNLNGEFNIPCGKTDFNSNNCNKIRAFKDRIEELEISVKNIDCFSQKAMELYEEADIIYMDPPYLITTAVYNESSGWTEDHENRLLNLISELSKKGKVVFLSNVLESDGRENVILKDWCKQNSNIVKVHYIDKHYRSSSYNKKVRGENTEVLIEVKNENK